LTKAHVGRRVSAAGMRPSSLQECIHGVTLTDMSLCQCSF
jgi:hypothetical protein